MNFLCLYRALDCFLICAMMVFEESLATDGFGKKKKKEEQHSRLTPEYSLIWNLMALLIANFPYFRQLLYWVQLYHYPCQCQRGKLLTLFLYLLLLSAFFLSSLGN